MGFRDKMRKAVGRTTSEEQTPTLATSGKTDVDVYKTGEVPPSKYRSNWNKEHQEKLGAFSFNSLGEAFSRRKSSYQSDVSPGGSRRSSWVGFGKKDKHQEASHVGQVVENADGDDDPTNVGISRPQTSDKSTPRADGTPRADDTPRADATPKEDGGELEQQETVTNGRVDQSSSNAPFSGDELTKALTATKLSDREEGREENGAVKEPEATKVEGTAQ